MSQPSSAKRVRALDRGLAVVEHLARHGASGLAGLRQATGLGNATLLRVLATLQDRGWVRRNIVEGQYELTGALGRSLGARHHAHPLAELGAPVLAGMRTRGLGLPSDLCALVGPGRIEVIESTRSRGPMAPERTGLGIRPSMLLSAHGRAILAFAPAAERAAHLAELRRGVSRRDSRFLDPAWLEAELRRTRQRGFGLREEDYFEDRGVDPGPNLGAIAVPILSQSGVHGTISLLWLRDDTTLAAVLALGSLDDMHRAAARIGQALDRAGVAAPAFATA